MQDTSAVTTLRPSRLKPLKHATDLSPPSPSTASASAPPPHNNMYDRRAAHPGEAVGEPTSAYLFLLLHHIYSPALGLPGITMDTDAASAPQSDS